MNAEAQKDSSRLVSFIPMIGNDQVTFVEGIDTSLQLDLLKMYIGHIEFWLEDQIVWQDSTDYYLLNSETPESFNIQLALDPSITYDAIQFDFGVDSTTNVSGAYSGALDPLYGMYWAWQSGYINFKLEGTCNTCPTRHQEFQFHLGGYNRTHNAFRKVKLNATTNSEIKIALQLDQIISTMIAEQNCNIMRPSEAAVEMSDVLSHQFSIVPH